MPSRFRSIAFTSPVRASQQAYYGRAFEVTATGDDTLGPAERAFIEQRDSFYVATVGATGWPYLQHRGGPPGFLHVLADNRVAFLDLAGNRQLISTGNLATNDRVAAILVDYPSRSRLKLLGHATVTPAAEAPALADRLRPPGIPATDIERVFEIRVVGWDWNCPKYITPRFTRADLDEATEKLRRRIAQLKLAARARSRT